MRGVAFVAASVVIGGCSLFTDLGGLEDAPPSTIIVVADGGGLGDGAVTSSSDAAGATDAVADVVPANVRYSRTLTLNASLNGAPLGIGYTHCVRLAPDVINQAITEGKLRADLGDLRIHGANGEIPAVVDPLGPGRAEVCWKLERAIAPGASDTYELRYGDPAAQTQTVTRSSFFDFYDGFAGTAVDTAKWLVWGTPVVANGRLELRKGAEHGITTIAASDSVPTEASLEIRAEIPTPSSDALVRDAGTFYYWLGFQHTGDWDAYYPWEVFIARGKFMIQPEVMTESGTCASICTQSYTVQTTDRRIYRVDRASSSVTFMYDDDTTYTAAQAPGDLSIMVRTFLEDSDLYVYWVRARPLVSPEPALAVGVEKTL
jgi:hypothetical protein